MSTKAFRRLAADLEQRKRERLYRSLNLPAGRDFTSNDYLGLARHPALAEAVRAALDTDGAVGAEGSRLLRGHHQAHAALEARAARVFGREAALYFGSGYLANFALFSTLCGRRDAIVFDERIHASMKDGIHAAPARRYRAAHNDLDAFEDAMRRARDTGAETLWLAIESVYSMDGDFAPLGALGALARRYDAVLIVDEAHATGVFGDTGGGLAPPGGNLIAVHTCGKALGVFGALVCGPALVIDYLINAARPFIYATAPPPMLARALLRALDLLTEEPWRRETVLARARFAADKLAVAAGEAVTFAGSPIIPVILGESERALAIAAVLQAGGFDVRAVRPPTVAEGTARLRLSIHADHSEDEIAALAEALARALRTAP